MSEVHARTSAGNNNDDDNQGGDMPSWMFKDEPNRKLRMESQRRNQPSSRKMIKQDVKVQEGTMEGKCVAGPVLTIDQAKKSDKVHPLKVKEAMSSVDSKLRYST